MSDLFWLADAQMEKLRPFFPKSCGRASVDDRRVLSGIIFINRNGLRWRDASHHGIRDAAGWGHPPQQFIAARLSTPTTRCSG
jgi:hypothetical protein